MLAWGIWAPSSQGSVSILFPEQLYGLVPSWLLKNRSVSQASGRREEQGWLRKAARPHRPCHAHGQTERFCRCSFCLPGSFHQSLLSGVKVAFWEKGICWLSQGKNDENQVMRNSFHLSVLLELFWQAPRTVCSKPIYKFARVFLKRKKEKEARMRNSPSSFCPLSRCWADAKHQHPERPCCSPLPLFLGLWAGRTLRTRLTQGSHGPERWSDLSKVTHRPEYQSPCPVIFSIPLCPLSKFPLKWDSHQVLKPLRAWWVQTRFPQMISRAGWRSRERLAASAGRFISPLGVCRLYLGLLSRSHWLLHGKQSQKQLVSFTGHLGILDHAPQMGK